MPSAKTSLENAFHDVMFLINQNNRVHKNPELNTRVAREAYESACKTKLRKMSCLGLEKFARDLESRGLIGNKRRL